MGKELIVNVEAGKVRLALLVEGRLMELHEDTAEKKFSVGDFYVGRVKKIAPGLNAAFVNIGYEKDAFLHYHDLGRQLKSLLKYTKATRGGKQTTSKLDNFVLEDDIPKDGKVTDVLTSGEKILIQVAKEPISTKGPRITSELSIAGRYVVLVPFSDKVSISQKIKDKEERERLQRLVSSIKPKGFGIIIRTVAKDKKVAELHADINYLVNKWNQSYNNLRNRQDVPSQILSEMDRASSVLRDNFDSSFTKIVCDDEQLCEEMKEYIEVISPGKKSIVNYYDGHTPIFEKYSIEKQIKTSFGKTVTMPKGAYLVIEHTEALHVIDVNSGNSTGKKGSQEENAIVVNKAAATEIARQLRLRDMGGIIVIDFIDMTSAENRKELYEHFREAMQSDKAKHKILPPSKFGLIQVTRQRVRPVLNIKTKEVVENQDITTPADMVMVLNSKLSKLLSEDKATKIHLHVHPFVAAYLKKGFPSIHHKWFLKYKKWIKVIPRDAYSMLEYHFFDNQKKEI
ncbi:ribonuclease [Flavobacteriaceae bacterium UJ101]|nr:ribonuclease [Flavobacteriaceae bacterium UJ101]